MTSRIQEIDLLPSLMDDNVTDVIRVTNQKSLTFDERSVPAGDVTAVTDSNSFPLESLIVHPAEAPPMDMVKHIPYEKRPCWHVYENWTTLDNGQTMRPGVYWLFFKEGKDAQVELLEKWICSPLVIDAQTFDVRGNNFGRYLRFKDSTGRWRQWAMPMELLSGSGEEMRGTLLSMGVLIDPSCFKDLLRYLLQTIAPAKKLNCTLQTGWHGRRAYALPDKIIGPDSDKVVFQSNQATYEEFGVAGTMAAWREAIAAKAVDNPMLALGLSCAFVGPLLALTNSEGGGVHMVGDSSSGKSSIARAAASVWGGKEYRRNWSTTANGLEGLAALFTDGLLVLDEISQCEPSDVGKIVYALGNGYGKQRANRHGSARSVTRWLTFVLSNGERSLATSVKEGGSKVKAGQTMRLLDLPIKRKHGIWDNLYDFENGAELSDFISAEGLQNYGHAGRIFLDRLTHDDRDFKKSLNQIKSLIDFKSVEGQQQRAAGRFALVALAGELATEYGITGWPPGTAESAAILGFKAWKSQRGEGSEEKRQIFSAVSDFIERHGDGRFSDFDDDGGDKLLRDRAGYWREENGVRVYYFNSDGMKETLKGFDFKLALDLLEQTGIIPTANARGERSRTMRLPSGKGNIRLYKVDFELLQNGGQPFYPAQLPEI